MGQIGQAGQAHDARQQRPGARPASPARGAGARRTRPPGQAPARSLAWLAWLAASALAAVAGPPALAAASAASTLSPTTAASAASAAPAPSASTAAACSATAAPEGGCTAGLVARADPLQLAHALVAAQAHGGRPFAIVDKAQAQLLVFDARGLLAGRSAALLGRARGDRSAPGVGERTQQGRLRDADRTTPAGHFRSEPGRNRDGEAVVWVDYDAAFAIHRLRPGPDQVRRSRSLAGSDPQARRLSAGCVVVPGAFFDEVVQPLLGRQRALVVVMPEGGTAAVPADADA